MLHNEASGSTLPATKKFLDTSTDFKMDLFKFYIKYGMKLRIFGTMYIYEIWLGFHCLHLYSPKITNTLFYIFLA